MKVLVTGTSSGLGKFLAQALSADKYDRSMPNSVYTKEYDLIIHSAFNTTSQVLAEDFSSYLADNIGLTEKLTSIPHKKFVFISSVDVYPKDGLVYIEDSNYQIGDQNLYGLFKLQAEQIVERNCTRPIIIRPSAMLGLDTRKNSLMKILFDEGMQLSLAAESEFNYILHSDVLSFIRSALQHDASGIYNLTASTNITLAEVVKQFAPQKNISFGNYKYHIGQVSSLKAAEICPELANSSIENIKRFLALG